MIMICSGCGRKRLWPTVNKCPDSGLECLMATKKLIYTIFSNQHLKFLTSRVWIKLWQIRHWNWEDAVCFVLLQLASGQNISAYVNTFMQATVYPAISTLTGSLNTAQTTASTALKQLNAGISSATQNLQTSIQNATNSAQQAAASAIASTPQAQAAIQACAAQANQSLATLNSTASK